MVEYILCFMKNSLHTFRRLLFYTSSFILALNFCTSDITIAFEIVTKYLNSYINVIGFLLII